MKSLRNKVILSGIVLMFAFIATIGSTYAWFTVSTETNIQAIQLNVTAADNLLMMVAEQAEDEELLYLLDAYNYKTQITTQDFLDKGYLFTGDDPWRLQPSTVLGGHVTEPLTYLQNIENRVYTLATKNAYNGQYIELKFWLLSQSEDDKVIQVSDFGIVTDDLGNTATQLAVRNAVRLAIWLDDSEHGDHLSGVPTGKGAMYLFGRDNDYGFTFTSEMPGFNDTVPANNVAPDQTGFDVKVTADLPSTDLYTVKFNIPTLVTVLIYIEGWDAHATNDIILATFAVNFSFKYKG